MPGPQPDIETGTASGPDMHIKKLVPDSPSGWSGNVMPATSMFVAPDDGVRKVSECFTIPMPHPTIQFHGNEYVKPAEPVSGQTLRALTRCNRNFFRALLANTVKHV